MELDVSQDIAPFSDARSTIFAFDSLTSLLIHVRVYLHGEK